MLTSLTSIYVALRNSTIPLAQLMIVSVLAFPLVGCGAGGEDGPVVASTSAATDDPTQDGDSPLTDLGDIDADIPPSSFIDADISPSSFNDEDPTISVPPTQGGTTARLNWDASVDPNVTGYYVYYGKQSSGQPGSCAYEGSQEVEAPPAIITGLEPNTRYFFAISAYGESESPCSNEIQVSTTSTQG
jgi:hypothetical protein